MDLRFFFLAVGRNNTLCDAIFGGQSALQEWKTPTECLPNSRLAATAVCDPLQPFCAFFGFAISQTLGISLSVLPSNSKGTENGTSITLWNSDSGNAINNIELMLDNRPLSSLYVSNAFTS